MPAAQRWASGMTQRVSPGLGHPLLSLPSAGPHLAPGRLSFPEIPPQSLPSSPSPLPP